MKIPAAVVQIVSLAAAEEIVAQNSIGFASTHIRMVLQQDRIEVERQDTGENVDLRSLGVDF